MTAASHEKYDRNGPSIVGTVVSAESATTKLRLVQGRRAACRRLAALTYGTSVAMPAMPSVTMSATIAYTSEAGPQDPRRARNRRPAN
jgi:hypothetical protein